MLTRTASPRHLGLKAMRSLPTSHQHLYQHYVVFMNRFEVGDFEERIERMRLHRSTSQRWGKLIYTENAIGKDLQVRATSLNFLRFRNYSIIIFSQ